MRHVISSTQFTKEDLTSLFVLTSDIKKDPSRYYDSLRGKVVATLFYEPSTRTRLSFESAIQRLGASLISTENAREVSSSVKGESLQDTVRIVEGYAEAIVMRHYENDAAAEASRVASVPIINAGGGSGEHPTQSLLDGYTIFEQRSSLDHLSVAVIGDLRYGRTVHSLVKMLSLFEDLTIYGVGLPGLELSDDYIQYIEDNGGHFIACSSLSDVPSDVDVLYQTRTQRERMSASQGSVQEIIIDRHVLNRFGSHTMVLHPLPRNQEIASDVDGDPRALYFQQAKNGMWIRMALLYSLLTENR
ncbi:aspartate carbamoyltransferase [Shimazuella sp. AN120528]|uniref:aspartate carbamoyltransferase n=1 Tax=Shimazuella soli TaxID=1892854 RepID=UPI001F0E3D6E|nr:aspartate carbamoyltransferase [Shimazuella soli]MCH5585891.1 aspartate carbamoyltransferase [Shimazuella soli]